MMNESKKAERETEGGLTALKPAPRSFQETLVRHNHSRGSSLGHLLFHAPDIRSVLVRGPVISPEELPLHSEPSEMSIHAELTDPTRLPGATGEHVTQAKPI